MEKREIDALERVIDYMWEDEATHFCEMHDKDYPPFGKFETLPKECGDEDHIYCSLFILERYLRKSRK